MPGINVTGNGFGASAGKATAGKGSGAEGLLGPAPVEDARPFSAKGPRTPLAEWHKANKANANLARAQADFDAARLSRLRRIGKINANLDGFVERSQSSSLSRWHRIGKINAKLEGFLERNARAEYRAAESAAYHEKRLQARKDKTARDQERTEDREAARVRRLALRDAHKEQQERNKHSAAHHAGRAFESLLGRLVPSAGEGGAFQRWRIGRQLDRAERRAQAEIDRPGTSQERRSHLHGRLGQIRQARARMQGGAEAESGLEGLSGKLGAAVGVLAMAVEAVAKAPFTINDAAQALTGLARPYVDYRYGSAALGRMGGWDGTAFAGLALGGLKTRGNVPISGEEALSLASSFGIGTESPEAAARLAGDIKDASRMEFMPNVDPRVLGGFAGQMANMGATFATPGVRARVNGEDAGPQAIMRAGASSLHPFFKDLQRTLIPAFAQGIDASRAMASVGALARVAAINGGAGTSLSAAGDFFTRYAMSGAAAARTGDIQMSAMQGMAKAASGSGYGGDAVQNYMLNAAVERSGGLKALTTDEGLRRFLGVSKSQYAEMTATPAGRRQMDWLMMAAREGHEAAFMTEAGVVSAGSFGDVMRNHWYDLAPGFAHGGSLEALERGAVVGQGANNVIISGAGGVRRPLSREDHDRRAKYMYALYTKGGLSPAAAAGLVARADLENGLRGTGYGDSGEAYGMFQWHPDRRAAIAAHFGKRVEDMDWREQAAAEMWEMSAEGPEARAGAAVRAASDPYAAGAAVSAALIRPGRTLAAQAAQAQATGSLASRYAQRFAGGDLSDGRDPSNTLQFDTMLANAGRTNLTAGEAGFGAAEAMLTGPLGKGMTELSDITTKVAGYVEDFGKAVLKLTFGVTAIPGRAVAPAGSHY